MFIGIMTDQVESILWCSDCITKHARDLLHHAEAREDSEMKALAQRAFNISTDMLGVKDKQLYSDIRDLEHHVEDLLTGLRAQRKKITTCTYCGDLEKNLNTGATQELNTGGFMEKELVRDAAIGNAIGIGVSRVTPMLGVPPVAGLAGKTVANVAIGLGLTAGALYGKLKGYELVGAVAGTSLLLTEIIDLIMGYIPAPSAVYAPSAVMAAPVSVGGLYATQYGGGATDGGLVFVD